MYFFLKLDHVSCVVMNNKSFKTSTMAWSLLAKTIKYCILLLGVRSQETEATNCPSNQNLSPIITIISCPSSKLLNTAYMSLPFNLRTRRGKLGQDWPKSPNCPLSFNLSAGREGMKEEQNPNSQVYCSSLPSTPVKQAQWTKTSSYKHHKQW